MINPTSETLTYMSFTPKLRVQFSHRSIQRYATLMQPVMDNLVSVTNPNAFVIQSGD